MPSFYTPEQHLVKVGNHHHTSQKLMIALHLCDGHQSCQFTTSCHPNTGRQRKRQRAKTEQKGLWVRDSIQRYMILSLNEKLFTLNTAETKSKYASSDYIKTLSVCERTNISTIFPQYILSLNNTPSPFCILFDRHLVLCYRKWLFSVSSLIIHLWQTALTFTLCWVSVWHWQGDNNDGEWDWYRERETDSVSVVYQWN